MNKIEITVLSARVLDALSGRGLKAKTVHEFERYGTRRIVKHCLGKGQILYSKETVQNFVWQERAKQESGTLPHYQWGITRRAAVYLDQMAEYGKIQDEPIRPWEAEHNPLFQAISCNPSNSMKVIDIICRTRDAVMQLELSDKTKTNYIYCGFGAILNFFISRGEESYSPETLALFEKTVQENFVNGAMQKASFQTMRKAAHWIEEYLSTGQVSQQKLRKYNFACAPPEFENLLSQYQLYMDNENYLKEGSRQFYLSSVRTFFRTIATLGIYRYAEITLPDVTRCLAKISETFPLGIFNLTGSMRSFARFMAEKHPELPDISPALVFSAAKRRRVYVGYTHEDAQKIFSAINRSSTMGMRDYAMIMLAYTTGLRGCDIVNLKFDSIDWDACELRLVQEKTNIPVSLPLDTKTGNAIADYILHARPKCKSEYIFLRVLRPYTKIGSMWTVIAKYAHIALGKNRKMNGPHAFRRGMGRQLLEANIPAPLICDILGHSSSVSLRQYTASSLEKLKVCAGTISAIPIPISMTSKGPGYVPHIFNEAEIKAFFHGADSFRPHGKAPARHLVIPVFYRLLYCCGLRPAEARLLKKENVDLVRGSVYVVESKGHKDRVVAVADDLLQIMRSYSTLISEIYPDSDYFFPRYDGDGPYTKRWTEEMFWRCFSMAGITAFEGPKPRVYDFRHTFATECICRWMREGRDIDAMLLFLSAYMGHARYEDTLYYVHMVPDFYERVGTVDRTAWEKLLPEVHDEG